MKGPGSGFTLSRLTTVFPIRRCIDFILKELKQGMVPLGWGFILCVCVLVVLGGEEGGGGILSRLTTCFTTVLAVEQGRAGVFQL